MTTLALEYGRRPLDRGIADGIVSARSKEAVPAAAECASARGLDWFTFFLADIQTGFGPFLAIYLTARHWAQFDIGLVLTVGGLVALAAQVPGGALVDAIRSRRLLAAIAVAVICLSALALAIWPNFQVVMATRMLHAAASCVLGPVIAALSLGLVGYAALGERLGRNARFSSIGNGVAAAAMGACGYLISIQAVFILTAAMVAPAIIALAYVRPGGSARPDHANDKQANDKRANDKGAQDTVAAPLRRVLTDRRLIIFAGCIMLFQLANAAILPLVGSIMTLRSGEWASTLIGACIVVPQLMVAASAPFVGRVADSWGRKPLLLLCFAALALRAMLFAVVANPYLVIGVQALDGVCAAVLGVLVPLVVADITRGTGRFNLGLGIVGCAVGIGAALSTSLAGYAMDRFGAAAAFCALASIAIGGLASIWLSLPETRPGRSSSTQVIADLQITDPRTLLQT